MYIELALCHYQQSRGSVRWPRTGSGLAKGAATGCGRALQLPRQQSDWLLISVRKVRNSFCWTVRGVFPQSNFDWHFNSFQAWSSTESLTCFTTLTPTSLSACILTDMSSSFRSQVFIYEQQKTSLALVTPPPSAVNAQLTPTAFSAGIPAST